MKLVWVMRLGFAGLMVTGLLVGCGESGHSRNLHRSSPEQPYAGRPGHFTPAPVDGTLPYEIQPMAHVKAPRCLQLRGPLHENSIVYYDDQPCPIDGAKISQPKQQFQVVSLKPAPMRYIRQPVPQWEIRLGSLPVGRLVSHQVVDEQGHRETQYWLSEFCSGFYASNCRGLGL